VDLDALEPIEPEELAARVESRALRRQLVRAMIVLSIADADVDPRESDLVERFADALGENTYHLTTFRHMADKHALAVRFDVARRFWAREKAAEQLRVGGLGWAVRSMIALFGLKENEGIANRYRALEHAPAGSLGKTYFDGMRSHGFSLPGEKGSPPEFIVLHDLTHVLSGYGVDPEGELQVAAFHAGCRREEKDPFAFIMFALASFQLDMTPSPIVTGTKGKFDPERFLRALERGTRCTIDPTDGWDPWSVMNEPLEALRDRYHITPLT
jgi:hypothetical protein